MNSEIQIKPDQTPNLYRKEKSIYDSRTEKIFGKDADQILADPLVGVCHQVVYHAFARRIDYPKDNLSAAFAELRSADCLITKGEDREPICVIAIDGFSGCESSGDNVVCLGDDPRSVRRCEKFSEDLQRFHSVSLPALILPGEVARGGYEVIARRLLLWFNGECRRIDPDQLKWDYLIQVVRRNVQLLRKKGQQPKLVDAGQLTLQLEHS
jgi:hypothetical protein